MDQDEISKGYREASVGCTLPNVVPFGQAVSEEKIFRNRLIRNNNCTWRPRLLMDQDEMRHLYRGLPVNSS